MSAYLQRQGRQVVGILAKRGGRFAVIKRGSKLPTRKGWNQTENTIDAAQARNHLAAGDNITLACGTGNLYAFDLDADAERGHECAQLAGGLYIYRENAPQKAKFIFTCPDAIPTRLKNKTHGIDLLGLNSNGTHWSCVVAGMHSSGAPILWGGSNVPVLSADTVAALWQEWTGAELFAPEREARGPNPTYEAADVARVADALSYVDPDALDYNEWIGVIAAVKDGLGDDALDMVVEWANGKHGEVEAKWRTFDREYTGNATTLDGVFYRARKAGWPDTWLQERLAEYRGWLASPDAIEELKAAEFRNPEQARKLLDTLLQKCEERKSLRITPGYAYLSKNSTIALGGLSRYLSRLFVAGFINLQLGEKGGGATTIELVFHNVNTPANVTPLDSVFHNVNSNTLDGETIHVVKNWNIYREHRDSEAFINGHHAYNSTRTKAELKPLGANGLGALLALQDGSVTTKEAAAIVGYTYGAMARTLRRYVEHDMVDVGVGERNRKTYTLKAEWREILKANLPKMPTYGVQLVRHVAALKSKEAMSLFHGEDEKAEKIGKEHARMEALWQQVKAAAGIIPFVRPERQDAHAERLDRLRHVQRVGERAQHRPTHRTETAADKWRRNEYAKDFYNAQGEWEALNAWATMQHGPGWWTRRDQTDIIGQYRIFQMASAPMPTMHFEGVAA